MEEQIDQITRRLTIRLGELVNTEEKARYTLVKHEVDRIINHVALVARKVIKEEISNLRKDEFIETHDNSGHRYEIPRSKRDDWYKWCEISEDDPASWDAPTYAVRIDGMPTTDVRPYNHALEDVLKLLDKQPDTTNNPRI